MNPCNQYDTFGVIGHSRDSASSGDIGRVIDDDAYVEFHPKITCREQAKPKVDIISDVSSCYLLHV